MREEEVQEAFEKDGFVVLRQFLSPCMLDNWQRVSEDFFQATFEILHKNGHTLFPQHCRINESGGRKYAMGLGVKNGFREIVMRSPGRYEMSLLYIDEELWCPHSLSLNVLKDMLKDHLATVVPVLLNCNTWDQAQISNLSVVMSTPGSPEQSWHADGGHVDLTKHAPCHCLNVFVPLTDVTVEMGPTEFRPGTHYHTRDLARMMLVAKARKTLRPPVSPTLQRGDVLLFDYRVLHRGKANLSKSNRTFLVMTVAKPWFKDVLNFPTRSIQDRKEEAVDER